MNTARAPGYYWIRAADGSAVIARLMPDGKRWMTAGEDVVRASDTGDDVLAGPLQAPRTAPIVSGITGQPIDDWDGSLRKRLDEIDRGEDVGSCHAHALALDSAFERDALKPDGTIDYEASRPVKADLSGWAAPMVSGEENRARARDAVSPPFDFKWSNPGGITLPDVPQLGQHAAEVARYIDVASGKLHELRSRARALLEGTTPGPWRVGSVEEAEIEGARGETLADLVWYVDRKRNRDLILGAHALLTELAKGE